MTISVSFFLTSFSRHNFTFLPFITRPTISQSLRVDHTHLLTCTHILMRRLVGGGSPVYQTITCTELQASSRYSTSDFY